MTGGDADLPGFCAQLSDLHAQAGGPQVASMAADVTFPLRRTQIYKVLNGEVRRPPSWDFVAAFVQVCVVYATRHDNEIFLPTDLAWWRHEHHKVVSAVDHRRHIADAADERGRPVPEQLPPTVANFVGREQELQALSDRLRIIAGTGAPIVITALVGAGGVGKTALALRWAHQVRDQFPDGQLFVNLRGFDSGQVVPAHDALAGFLVALGVAEPELPATTDRRTAMFRTLAARRRLLVVLDNATDAEHVRGLLPGAGTSVVVVTSRDRLGGLVSVDGAGRVTLTPLDERDAIALLHELVGARVAAEPDQATALARQCCRVPLALRIAAELIVSQPDVPLHVFVTELDDVSRRLEILDAADDPRSALRAVFSWSYRCLPDAVARAFRLAGLHPGTSVTTQTLSMLAGASEHMAQDWLNHLVRVNLADSPDRTHAAMHDLLRGYARSLAEDLDTPEQRRQSLERLIEHYVQTAADAAQTLFTDADDEADRRAAQYWLDDERHNIVLVAGFAATHGWPTAAGTLSSSLWRYFVVGGHLEQAMALHTHALTAALTRGDLGAQARALGNLGVTYFLVGRHDEALKQMTEALRIFAGIDDQQQQSSALNMLGSISEALSRYDDAADYYQQSLRLARALANQVSEANALDNLGNIDERRGNYTNALQLHRQARDIFADLGDRDREAITLLNFGGVYRRLGHLEQALAHYTAAADLLRELGDRPSTANALTGIADATAALGAPTDALPLLHEALAICAEIGDLPQQGATNVILATVLTATGALPQAHAAAVTALKIARDSGDRHLEANALLALGQAALLAQRYAEATEHFTSATDVAASTGDRDEQARGLAGLGYTLHATGDLDGAHQLWQDARELAERLRTPLAAEMDVLLAEA